MRMQGDEGIVLSQYGDAGYWRTAAIHARAMAATFHDAASRLAMLEIAIKYEAIARRARALETGLRLVDNEEERRAG